MKKGFILLTIFCLFSFTNQVVKAQEPKGGVITNVMIILDSSGSMSSETKDGKQKLAAAKTALKELIEALPDGLNTGLIVYGHRHKARCDDIEVIFSLRPLTGGLREAVWYDIKKLEPLGVTPIADSLTLAGETLKGFEGENSIILISDGKETCGGDPVRVAAELEEKYGIKVYVDVIGFDVTKKEREQLELIATAGRGRYYNADTAKELSIATKKVAEERKIIQTRPVVVVPEPPEIIVPPPPEPEKKEAEFLQRGEIDRGGKPLRGGKYYDDAVEIEPGEYHLDHKLRENEFDYFKIVVKNGQRLNCSVRTTDLSKAGAIAIHSLEKVELRSTSVFLQNTKGQCFYELYDSAEKEKIFYIVIGISYAGINENAIFKIWLEDHFDANSGTDAGNYYDTAIEISPATYENNWACYGDIDMYKLHLAKGDELKVKVMPDKCENWFYLTMQNEDRETMLKAQNKEKGAVVKGSLLNEADEQDIFIKIDHELWTNEATGKYIMEIKAGKPEVEKPQEAAS